MHTTIETTNSYEGTTDNLTITNGSKFVSVTIVPGQMLGGGVFTGLTAAQAREAAAALIAGAEDIENNPYGER